MARVAELVRNGEPEEAFEVRERPDPRPEPGEVAITVEAAGINFADVLMRRGVYAGAPSLPFAPGYEVAGRVAAVGAGVDEQREGDPVLAMTQFGGYATRVAVPATQVWRRPDGMSAEEGAALPVNYLTAYEAMVVMGSVRRPDELGGVPTRVLVHGASGGVGTAAADVGRFYDAELFGTASPWKHDYAREHGYDHLIDYRNDDFVEAVMDLTGGRGVDLVLDPIGGRHWRRSMEVLAPTGRLCVFGMASASAGPMDMLKMMLRVPWWRFTPFYLMAKSVGVVGYFLAESAKLGPETRLRGDLLLHWYEEGHLRPHVDRVFALGDVAEAHRYLEGRESVGKVLLLRDGETVRRRGGETR